MTISANQLVARLVFAREIICSSLLAFMFGATSYHPHKYYMRGPGPKWREKHGIVLAHDEMRG